MMQTCRIYDRKLQVPSSSFFLFGMRGVGKTTWARARFADARWVDLLREDVYQAYLADARLFRRELAGLAPGQWVVVDEIQRVALGPPAPPKCLGRRVLGARRVGVRGRIDRRAAGR